MEVKNEIELTPDQVALCTAIAKATIPPPRLCNDDDVRAVIGALAGILKAQKTSFEGGLLKLGMYRKAMVGKITYDELAYASSRALDELEWMPVPSELIKMTKGYRSEELRIQGRCKALMRARNQRIFETRCKRLREKFWTVEELQTLPEQEIEHGLQRRVILRELDGSISYWTPELERELKEKRLAELNEKPIARAGAGEEAGASGQSQNNVRDEPRANQGEES